MVVDTLFDALVLILGVGMIGHAASLLRHLIVLYRLGRTDTGAIETPGRVAVQGTIQTPIDEPIQSPIQQELGCLAKWTVEEYVGHSLGVGGGWTDFGTGYETIPFIIDDGTGPIAIDITGEERLRKLELELPEQDDEPVYEQDVTEPAPTHIHEFLTEFDDDIREHQGEASVPTTENGDEQGDRRYYEQVLQTGDTIYVVGHASVDANPDPHEVEVTISADSSDPFYLSDRERMSAWKRRLARIGVTGGLGVGLTWYGLAQFLTTITFSV